MPKPKQQVIHSFAKQESDKRGVQTEVGRELAGRLADTYVLTLKTHSFHWNVEGSHFYSLHKLLEEQYQELFAAADAVAERMRAIGEFAPGSFQAFRSLTSISEAGEAPFTETQIVQDLLKDHETVAKSMKKAIEVCEESDDMGTADLLTARLIAHEKAAWMLRSLKE